MKKGILVICAAILIVVVWNNRGYETLEEAVQSKWDTPIKVINQDSENQLVYYLDHGQHVIGTYGYKNGKYFYDNKQSSGMRFSSANGLPFYVSYKHFEGAGDIVYGAISTENHVVDKFVIHYENGEVQEIKAKNNTFMADTPFNMDPTNLISKISKVHGYDSNGDIIESWN